MAFTETTYTSWFGQIRKTIGGVIFGIVVVPIAIIVLFWNEGRAVHTARTLEEGKSIVVSAGADTVNAANEGKLIHFTARAINADGGKLADPIFKVSADAIHLRRKVQMFEWKEEKETHTRNNSVGGGSSETTTYTYNTTWQDAAIDSSDFKEHGHDNPSRWRLERNTVDAQKVTAGAFTLNRQLVDKIDDFSPVTINAETVDGLADDLKSDSIYNNSTILIANDTGHKPDPGSPNVGDMRVTFEAALPGDVSVIAKQTGSNLEPYQTKNNPLQLLYVGSHSSDEMFQTEQTRNTQITWIVRAGGFIGIWIGLGLLLSPLRAVSSVVGIIGDIVGAGIAIVAGLVAVVLSFVTIAIAWITYRPVVGILMLIIAGGAVALLVVLRRNFRAARQGMVMGQVAGR